MGLLKHSNLASYALGNVLKYRTRSVAIITALVISTTLLCSAEFIREGVVLDITASMESGPDIIVQKLIGGRQTNVPIDWVESVSATTGVNLVTSRVWGYTDIGNGILMTIIGINATEYGSIAGVTGTDILGNGRFLEESDTRKIVIGQGIIDVMAASVSRVTIDVGTSISLISFNGSLIEFEVIGIFSSQSKAYSYDTILTDQNSARDLFGVDDLSCTDLAIWTTSGSNVNDVAFRLDTSLADARILTNEGITDELLKTYSGRSGIVSLLWAVLLLTSVMVAFTVSSAGSDEARREVGLLKALGFDTVDIIEIRMFESLTLGILSASLGISCAIVFDYILGAPILSGYLLGWTLLLLNWEIPLAISAPVLFTVYVIAIVPILVASVVPAWKNAITEPDVVLRGV
ncbi:MAG: ABC transporter permease [Candidatus Thorarchaeota archaeon]